MTDYNLLAIQNPWWTNSQAINTDPKIVEYLSQKYRFTPKNILSLPINPSDIHVITGPRQTGKSTAIKLLIQHLLQKSTPSNLIFYFDCEALSSHQDIINLITSYLNNIPNPGHSVIFLDEISSIPLWPQAVKWLVDAGLLQNSTLILSGSSSINLKKSGELMPGRRGRGKDITFYPIRFSDYLSLLGITAPSPKIYPAWLQFLKTGGLLKNINAGLDETTNDLYLKTFKSELYKAGKKEDNLRAVSKKLLASLSSQTSYTNIAEEAELGSKNTAVDYLNFLSDSFFTIETKHWDIPSSRLVLKKNKKFYSTDPYFLWLLSGFVTGSLDLEAQTNLIELPRQAENFVAGELTKAQIEFHYYQNSRELDFYIPKSQTGIEVKYKDKITSEDLKHLSPAKRKILVSKNTQGQRGDILIVPAHLFNPDMLN